MKLSNRVNLRHRGYCTHESTVTQTSREIPGKHQLLEKMCIARPTGKCLQVVTGWKWLQRGIQYCINTMGVGLVWALAGCHGYVQSAMQLAEQSWNLKKSDPNQKQRLLAFNIKAAPFETCRLHQLRAAFNLKSKRNNLHKGSGLLSNSWQISAGVMTFCAFLHLPFFIWSTHCLSIISSIYT